MQDFMRKHKRLILVFILAIIIVPFVFFFGNPSTGYKGKGDAVQGKEVSIGKVGSVPLSAAQFRYLLDTRAQMQTPRGGDRPSYRELEKKGEVEKVMEQMVNTALIEVKEKERAFDVDDALAAEQLKQEERFLDKDGNFNAESWNEWVEQNKTLDWNALYQDQKEKIARRVFIETLMAPANEVLNSEIQKQLEENSTKLQIKYAKIEPKVEVTDEELQKHYDENKDTYKTPDTRSVDFVVISLAAPVPQKALDVVKQAREGADFAKLADDNSDLPQKNGGDMSWVSERENEPEYRKAMFALKVGEVSEPVASFNSFYVYKVEEERTNADTQKREVHARQIMVKAELSKEDREKLDTEALAIKEEASAEGADFNAITAKHQLSAKRSGQFTKESTDIEGIAKGDVPNFRVAFEKNTAEPVTVVTTRSNIYVAKAAELIPGVVQPLDVVKDKVREDTIAAVKKTDDYKKRVSDYADKIKAQAKNLAQINELFPELAAEVKESSEFTRKDYLFKEQLYLQTTQIFDAVGRKEPGILGGPLKDFQGNTYFVELVKTTPPTDDDKKKWDDEKKKLRDSQRMAAQNGLLEDYLADLRERTLPNLGFSTDQKMMDQILGPVKGQEGDQPAEGETTAADGAAKAPEGAAKAPEGSK